MNEDYFRADLYYRLNVIPIIVPPLRSRRDDIPLLVDHFLKQATERSGRKRTIAKNALEILVNYDWPGNVRELENIMERAVILQDNDQITAIDIPDKIKNRSRGCGKLVMSKAQMTLEDLEKEYLISVLEETNWQKKKASAILGINASTLYRKIQRYNLSREKVLQNS